MVKLFCAIVGEAGSAFEVDIDANQTVGDLKDAIKSKNDDITGPARKLQLFLAKAESNAWLSSLTEDVKKLKKGEKTALVEALIHEANELQGEFGLKKVLAGMLPPSTDEIHVLVQLPDQVSTWKLSDENCPALLFDKSPLVRISTAYTLGSGLAVDEGKDLLLYRRSQLVEEWQSIETCVCNTFAELWTVRPPGTGKSCAAFAFACSLDRTDWDVVWIHCPKRGAGPLQCILFRGATEKWTCKISATTLASVLHRMKERTVVFVDGYTKKKDIDSGAHIENACLEWRDKKKEHHRLVWVSSMVSLGKENYQILSKVIPTAADAIPLKTTASFPRPVAQSKIKDEMLFELMSWTLEDYELAIGNDEFFENVKTNFTDTKEPVLLEERKQLLEDKFFVAGGSARYMFDFRVSEAVVDLDKAITAVDDIKGYVEGTRGIASEGAVNRLFSWYRVDDTEVTCLVSSHVARKLAKLLGPDYVQKISTLLSSNPSMDGHLYELCFFAKLSHGGVECYKIGQDGGTCLHDTWKAEKVPYFDPNGTIPVNQSKQWLAPRMRNQGGYDAVYVESLDRDTGAPTVIVRFVQVTRADKHSFKNQYFAALLTKLTSSLHGHHFQAVEVYFVVPIRKLATFKPKIDALQVQKDVLELAGLRSDTTKVAVEVVGLNYKEFRECDDLKRLETKRLRRI